MLDVEGLRVEARHRTAPVLNSISVQTERGEVLGVVGESGSGKTTFARCLLRVEAPLKITGGRIGFAGIDLVNARSADVRGLRGRRIALVPQDPIGAFDPLFPVSAQIRAFVTTHAGPIVAAAELAAGPALEVTLARLEAFGVPRSFAVGRTYPHAWSRGMLQRALFALATAPAPDLLVLDEPTAALDAPVADRLVADITRLARTRGTATILVTHDLALAATVCDRLLVLKDGAMIETGTMADVIGGAKTTYARSLVESAVW
ncbi:MAG: ATP-binding cassette domain-containing protein [Pseudomonadota bacterium]